MPDAELRAIKRDDLGDLARSCFDQEVSRRNLDLTPSQPPAAEKAPAASKEGQLVCVATFAYPDEAHVARALLESASIPSYLENEHTLAVNWMLTNVIGGLHLLVPPAYAEEARAILSSKVSDHELAAQAMAARKPSGV